jgi:iron complex outermembrane recepter protein
MAWGQNAPSQKASQTSPSDLTQVSIENLMNVEVTSVSKKEQKLSKVAATIFEINLEATQEARLSIRSRLLTLAKSVIGGKRGN